MFTLRAVTPLKLLSMTALALGSALILPACSPASNAAPTSSAEITEKNEAKNVIIFIGDGMGISTITAARIFDGQSQGKKGEEHELAFDTFENLALIKTYNTNAQVPDSAGTATAILSGYKTNIGAINVPPALIEAVSPDVCNLDVLPDTLTERAQKAGKAVGILSTARLTHATPAAMYGHVPLRSLEADSDMKGPFENCDSLAQQMVDSPAEVILGGGSKEFSEAQIETLKTDFIYVANKTEMMGAQKGKLRGLFNRSHMSFEADRGETDESPKLSLVRIHLLWSPLTIVTFLPWRDIQCAVILSSGSSVRLIEIQVKCLKITPKPKTASPIRRLAIITAPMSAKPTAQP